MAVVKIFTHYHQSAIIVIACCLLSTSSQSPPSLRVRYGQCEKRKARRRRKNNGPFLNKRLTHLSFAYVMFRFFFNHSSSRSTIPLLFSFLCYHFCSFAFEKIFLLFFLSAFHSLSFAYFFCFSCCCLYAWRLHRIIMWILLRLANNDAIHNRWGSLGMDVFCLYLGQLHSHLFYRTRTFRQIKNSCQTRSRRKNIMCYIIYQNERTNIGSLKLETHLFCFLIFYMLCIAFLP